MIGSHYVAISFKTSSPGFLTVTESYSRRKNLQQEAQKHCDFCRQVGTEMIDWTYNNIFHENKRILREKTADWDLDGRIQANLMKKPEIYQCRKPTVVSKRPFRAWYKNSQL